MNIRERLNHHPKFTFALAVIFILCSVGFAIRQNRGNNPGFASKAYFTDDDGATYFVDSFLKPYPFDHNGKPAYRACVYKIGNGPPFVAYLERYTDKGAAEVAPLLGSTSLADQERYTEIRNSEMEAKKPGGSTWFKVGTAGYVAATQIVPPGGPTYAEVVFP